MNIIKALDQLIISESNGEDDYMWRESKPGYSVYLSNGSMYEKVPGRDYGLQYIPSIDDVIHGDWTHRMEARH